MKLNSLILLSFILLLFSCRNESGTLDLLNRSEALLATNPDSAYTLLNTIQNPGLMSNKLLARWCMLTGESSNKIHEDMPYPDLLLRAQTWYTKHGTVEEQVRICLFLGRSYVADKEYEKAMTIYMEALEAADKNKIYNQAGYISSYIADLYEFKDMPDKARQKYEEGAEYFLKASNKRSYALALRDIAYTWADIDSLDYALRCMHKADSLACQINDRKAMASINNGLGNIYGTMENYNKAEEYLIKSLNFENKNNTYNFLALSNMYTNSGNIEKAYFYLEKAKKYAKNENLISVTYQQYLIAKANNKIEEALSYLEQYDNAADSITILQNNSNILKMEKKYHQEKILKENGQLHISKQRHFILIIFLIIICLTILSFYQIKLKRKQTKIYKQQIVLDKNNLLIIDLNKKIEEEDNELCQVKNELYKINKQKETYEQQKAELEQINNKIILKRRDKLFLSPIAKKVIKLSQSVRPGANKSPLTPKDWKAIHELVDEIYISLPQLLKNRITSFTPTDIECCYLSFFNLDPQAEAILLNINPDSASQRRSRLRKKLNLKSEDKSLYEYLTRL